MKLPGLHFVAFFAWLVPGLAQNADLEQLVSLDYSGTPLVRVITEMEGDYGVYFSYSADHLPLDYPISVFVQDMPLSVALEAMFEETPIVFALIGGQIMLRMDQTKAEDRIGSTSQEKPKPPIREPEPPAVEVPIETAETAEASGPSEVELEPLESIQKPVESTDVVYDFGREDQRFLFLDSLNTGRAEGQSVAQVSVFAKLGSNGAESPTTTNNLSLNVFWGNNGGVDGLELGGFFNTIQQDVRGLQVAGLGNRVKGNVRGTQVSSLFNTARGNSTGIQASGLANIAGSSNGIQAAGLMNISGGSMNGLQAAGLFNKAGAGSVTGLQFAGLFNTNNGKSDIQAAGLFNVGQDVRLIQMAAFLNVAQNVKGVQIGLINVADSVTGASIGLLNIVRHGYNHLDLSYDNAITGNVGLRLGSRHFYNIFQVGARWENSFFPRFRTENDPFTHWTFGYGAGTAITLGTRSTMNLELVVNHVSEGMKLTTDLNLLNQFRLIIDRKLFGSVRLFGGATFNLMVSKYYDPDSGQLGSTIVPYTWENYSTGLLDIRSWLGFTAGVRF